MFKRIFLRWNGSRNSPPCRFVWFLAALQDSAWSCAPHSAFALCPLAGAPPAVSSDFLKTRPFCLGRAPPGTVDRLVR